MCAVILAHSPRQLETHYHTEVTTEILEKLPADSSMKEIFVVEKE